MPDSAPSIASVEFEGDRLKVPPHSIQAEQSVLGGLMLDNEAWDQIADLITENDFYRRDHRLIFRAIGSLIDEGSPCDVITLSEWLDSQSLLDDAGGLAYLGTLAKDTPTAANIRAYADIVRENSVLRQLTQVGTRIANSAYVPEGRKSPELLDQAEQMVFKIAEQGNSRGSGFENIKDLLGRAVDRIDTLFHLDNPITGVPTGFADLDEMTAGLQPADLVIVAGRPSMGKTSFAMNIAEHAAIKHKTTTAVFSMEMPGDQLAMRMMSSLGRIDQHKMRTGKLDDDDWPRLTSAVSILAEAPLFIDDTPALSPTELRARARRLKREHDLGLIVIDYLQLMQVPGSNENRTTEISEISRGLKALAKELSVPVIALSQLNRSLEQRPNKRPVMSDLRECVTGDTLVVCADGSRVPVRDLSGQNPVVFAKDEQDCIVSAQSDKVWKVGRKPIFKVSLASGRSLRVTREHLLYTETGWRKTASLQVGNRLALARKIPEPAQPVTDWSDQRVALLGQLIGDGSYLKGQPMRYTTQSQANSDCVATAAREEFGMTVNRHAGRGHWHQLVLSGNGNRWQPAGVNKWFRELGIFNQRSHEKQIPAQAFRLADRQIALLLSHLWATDGSIYVRPADSRGSDLIHYATNSQALAMDVSALLQRLGIIARIKKAQKSGYRPGYMVCITGAVEQKCFLDRVPAFGPRVEQANRLADKLATVTANTNVDTLPDQLFVYIREKLAEKGISHRKMAAMRGTAYGGSAHFSFSPSRDVIADYAELLDDDYLRRQASNDLFWDRVVAVEEDGIEDVYDLTVPGPSSWLADGIVCHNSGAIEQDADVIIFIYRDEVYNEESPDKGTAEIIIGKQRNGPIGMRRLTFLGQHTRFENFTAAAFRDEDYE